MFEKSKPIRAKDVRADFIMGIGHLSLSIRMPERVTQAEYDRLSPGFDIAKEMLKERIITDVDADFQRHSELLAETEDETETDPF